jgi:hypothetical protein
MIHKRAAESAITLRITRSLRNKAIVLKINTLMIAIGFSHGKRRFLKGLRTILGTDKKKPSVLTIKSSDSSRALAWALQFHWARRRKNVGARGWANSLPNDSDAYQNSRCVRKHVFIALSKQANPR